MHMRLGASCLVAFGLLLASPVGSAVSSAFAQETLWQTWREGGLKALQEGRLEEAERLLIAALEQAEKYGKEDLRVADAANDLAVVYATAGRNKEAELLFHRALVIGEKGLGTDHPGVGATVQNLGILYATQQQFDDAEPLLQRALAINMKQFGVNHARTALTLKTLSSFYAIQGQLSEAEQLIQKSLSILEANRVRHGDPQLTATLEVFAAILRNTNREHEAQEIERRVEAGQDETLFH
jgi:tetratricopeptide (TPR) repeat protein